MRGTKTVHAKKLLDRISDQRKASKVKTSLFLDSEVYKAFKAICDRDRYAVSVVVEEMMRDFTESYNERSRSK